MYSNKKRKLNVSIDRPKSLSLPLLSLIYERHIVDCIFYFLIPYYPILKFVSKEWYFYCKEKYILIIRTRDYVSWFSALNGDLSLLKWARENGCPWYENTCSIAALNGYLYCLQWARENGCPWNEWTCSNAALNGHLDCLQWARENGCPWDKYTCCNAARNGHFDCLQWARENGCPWNEWTCTNAALNGHLDCLKWARENGCPWDKDICTVCSKILNNQDWYECDKCKNMICNNLDNQCGKQCGMCGEVSCHKCEKITNYVKCKSCGNYRDCCSECTDINSTTCMRC